MRAISIDLYDEKIEKIVNEIAVQSEKTILLNSKSFNTNFSIFDASLSDTLNLLCEKYHFHYTSNNKTIFIHECYISKIYKINNFISNEQKNDSSTNDLVKNNFWKEIEKYIKLLSNNFTIDRINGIILLEGNCKIHEQMEKYLKEIKTSIIVCEGNVIIIETMDGFDCNLNSIIDPLLENSDLNRVTFTILSILSNLDPTEQNLKARLQTSFRMCIVNQNIGTLSSYSDLRVSNKEITFDNNRRTAIKELKTVQYGFFLNLCPIIQNDHILLKVDLCYSNLEKCKVISNQNLSTVLKLYPGKIEKIGGLYHEKEVKEVRKFWFIPYAYSDYKKRYELVILLKVYII